MTTPEIKDSRCRQGFATGAVRDAVEGKPALELVSPIFLRRLGDWLAKGAKKYAPRNWEKGIPMDRSMGSLLRHTNQQREGDRSEDHLAAIACNVMFLIHTEEMVARGLLPKELDDIPNYFAPNAPGHAEGPEFGDDPWITLFSGARFRFFGGNDDFDGINIQDIAHSLSLQCRYKGHCRRFYSVAEHCVLVSALLAPEHHVYGLLHDAAEFVLGDAPAPIKDHLGRFRQLEETIMIRVYRSLGVAAPDEVAVRAVRKADRVALAAEARALFDNGDKGWCCEQVCVPDNIVIHGWDPPTAAWRFLDAYGVPFRSET